MFFSLCWVLCAEVRSERWIWFHTTRWSAHVWITGRSHCSSTKTWRKLRRTSCQGEILWLTARWSMLVRKAINGAGRYRSLRKGFKLLKGDKRCVDYTYNWLHVPYHHISPYITIYHHISPYITIYHPGNPLNFMGEMMWSLGHHFWMPGFWWINDGPSPTEKLDPGIPRDVAARWHFVHRHHDLRSQTLEPGSEALGRAETEETEGWHWCWGFILFACCCSIPEKNWWPCWFWFNW